MNFGERLKKARIDARLTQSQLAETAGISQQALQKLEKVTKDLGHTTHIWELSKALGKNPEWLKTGNGLENLIDVLKELIREHSIITELVKDYSLLPSNLRPYPLLSFEQIDIWINEPEKKEGIKNQLPPHLKDVSEGSFYIEIFGEAMQSNKTVSLPAGNLALVDPNRTPKPGNILLAKTAEGYKIRLYEQDGDQFILKALNENYPIISITKSVKIVGVVVLTFRLLA